MSLTPCPYENEELKKAWLEGYKDSKAPCPYEGVVKKAFLKGQRDYEVDIQPIPPGPYCYRWKEDPSKVKGISFPVINCPHLVYEERELYGIKEKMPICKFLERRYPLSEENDVAMIMDQVKNCGENNDY